MPRLRNTKTGAVVSTSDEIAARLGAEWEAVKAEAKAPAKKAAPRKQSAKKS